MNKLKVLNVSANDCIKGCILTSVDIFLGASIMGSIRVSILDSVRHVMWNVLEEVG
jgi:hypothetical protein